VADQIGEIPGDLTGKGLDELFGGAADASRKFVIVFPEQFPGPAVVDCEVDVDLVRGAPEADQDADDDGRGFGHRFFPLDFSGDDGVHAQKRSEVLLGCRPQGFEADVVLRHLILWPDHNPL
jgi:hypothetical protein